METESEGIKTYQGDGEGKATCCSIMGGTEGKRGGFDFDSKMAARKD